MLSGFVGFEFRDSGCSVDLWGLPWVLRRFGTPSARRPFRAFVHLASLGLEIPKHVCASHCLNFMLN